MEEPACWADDELDNVKVGEEFYKLETCAHCHQNTNNRSRYCDKCKEKFPNSPTKPLRKRIMLEVTGNKDLEGKSSDQGFCSDSGSDVAAHRAGGPQFSNLPSAQHFHLSDSPSTESEFDQKEESGTEDWRMTENGLLDDRMCAGCHQRPYNTCLVHNTQRHLCFCLECATQYQRDGGVCPLCPEPIVYIYKYDDI